MYNKEFWDKIKINDTVPKSNQAKPIPVKVSTVTEDELTRVSVLKAFLDRKKNKGDITIWEVRSIEEIIKFINKIWGTK